MRSLANKQPESFRYLDPAKARNNLKLVSAATVLFGLFVAIQTVHLTLTAHSPLLLLDEWRVLPRYIEFRTDKLSLWSFLWEEHFGHRPVLARLLFILDAELAAGTQVLTRTISISLCGLLTALFAMLLLRQKQIAWSTRRIGVLLLLLLLLSNWQVYNFGIGWNNAILTAVWFSVFAIYLLTHSVENRARGELAFVLLVCALLSGVLGSYSMANGLLIWPIMFLVCVRFQYWPAAIIVTFLGTIVTATYLWDFQRSKLIFDAMTQPRELLYFFLAFLGNPTGLEYFTVLPASTGALGLLLVAYHFLRQGWRIDQDLLTVWFLLGVCLFVIGTAALVSVSRLTFGAEIGAQPRGVIEALHFRYYSFASPLWAANLLLGFILLKDNLEAFPRNVWKIFDFGALVSAIVICIAAYFLSPSPGTLVHYLHELPERAATAIVAGAPDKVALKYAYPYPDVNIPSSVPYLAANRLSVFHSDVDYFLYRKAHDSLHSPLADGRPLNGKWCGGWIDDAIEVADGESLTATWYKISGWALDREMDRATDGVLFADEEGRLVGIGRMFSARPDADQTLNSKPTQFIVRYIGYVEMGSSHSVMGYAFTASRNELCLFSEKQIR